MFLGISQIIEKYNYVPYTACSRAYSCDNTNKDCKVKCKYCKEWDKFNNCIEEDYVECESNENE